MQDFQLPFFHSFPVPTFLYPFIFHIFIQYPVDLIIFSSNCNSFATFQHSLLEAGKEKPAGQRCFKCEVMVFLVLDVKGSPASMGMANAWPGGRFWQRSSTYCDQLPLACSEVHDYVAIPIFIIDWLSLKTKAGWWKAFSTFPNHLIAGVKFLP